jgi:hypothetical protein
MFYAELFAARLERKSFFCESEKRLGAEDGKAALKILKFN